MEVPSTATATSSAGPPANFGPNCSTAIVNYVQSEPSSPPETEGLVVVHGNKLPSGYKFSPSDVVLIRDYLAKKIANPSLCWDHIKDFNVYQYDPPQLIAAAYPTSSVVNEGEGDSSEWYFISERPKKYGRSTRSTKSGYWKGSGHNPQIRDQRGIHIGNKKSLVFFYGHEQQGSKPKHHQYKEKSRKTNWHMFEYELHHNHPITPSKLKKTAQSDDEDRMRLDGYVLCKIYIGGYGKFPKIQENEGIGRTNSRKIENPSTSSVLRTNDGMVKGNGNFQANSQQIVNDHQVNTNNMDPSQMQFWEDMQLDMDFIDSFVNNNSMDDFGFLNKK